jgi:branched-chain amino acid transport system permease protein
MPRPPEGRANSLFRTAGAGEHDLGRWGAGAIVFMVLAAIGPRLDGFTLSILTLVFLFGFFGQAWNIMTGFAGQLSLGHSLYVGIGAYTVVILSTRYGVSPWLGLVAAAAISAAIGAAIGWLGFRFSVRGFHFALLTIAFAEFGRIMFDNWSFVGATAGLFLPAMTSDASMLGALRGDARFFYYATLVLAAAGTALTAAIRMSAFGYIWRAIRNDEDAARALGVRAFRNKILATSMSAAATAIGGGLYGHLNGSLFPDGLMGLGLSIEIIIGPIVGGLGTAFGPLVGALLVVPLGQALGKLGSNFGLFGLNDLAYGLVLIVVIWLVPQGLWPALTAAAGHLAAGVRRHRPSGEVV